MSDLEALLNSLAIRHKRMVRAFWMLAAILLAGIVLRRERPAVASVAENTGEIRASQGLGHCRRQRHRTRLDWHSASRTIVGSVSSA